MSRCKKKEWMAGKILYIFLISVLYQFALFIGSILVIGRYVGTGTGWGSVILTEAFEESQSYAAIGEIGGMEYVTGQFHPLEALAFTFLILVLIGCMIGLFIFVVNGVTRTNAGTILLIVYAGIDLFCSSLDYFGIRNSIPRILSLGNLNRVYMGSPVQGKHNVWAVIILLLVINIILFGMVHKATKRNLIEFTR